MAVKLVEILVAPLEIDVSPGGDLIIEVSTGIPVVEVLELAYTGPRGPIGLTGPPGTAAEGTAIEKICQGTVPESRIVAFLPDDVVRLAGADSLDDRRVSIGLSKTAGGDGDTIEVLTGGEWTDATWTWNPGSVYLGLEGALTQVVPSLPDALFLRVMGVATNTDTIFLHPEPPVILA